MSEEEDVVVDLPKAPAESEFPDELRQQNELNRQGKGINPGNARRIIAGGDKAEPTQDDFAAVSKLLDAHQGDGAMARLWQQFVDYYWDTKQKNAGTALGQKGDPDKTPTYTPEQTAAYDKEMERRALMKRDYQRRNIESGNWKKFASSNAMPHQGDDTGIEGDR